MFYGSDCEGRVLTAKPYSKFELMRFSICGTGNWSTLSLFPSGHLCWTESARPPFDQMATLHSAESQQLHVYSIVLLQNVMNQPPVFTQVNLIRLLFVCVCVWIEMRRRERTTSRSVVQANDNAGPGGPTSPQWTHMRARAQMSSSSSCWVTAQAAQGDMTGC